MSAGSIYGLMGWVKETAARAVNKQRARSYVVPLGRIRGVSGMLGACGKNRLRNPIRA